MAEYHLLQEIEEAATPLNIRIRAVQSEVWKFIAVFACFLAFGTFTVLLHITIPILFSTDAAFIKGLPFLGTFLEKALAIQVLADRDPRCRSPWAHLQKFHPRREVSAGTVTRE